MCVVATLSSLRLAVGAASSAQADLCRNWALPAVFDYVDIEYNRFTSRVFDLFDKDHDAIDQSGRVARSTLKFEGAS